MGEKPLTVSEVRKLINDILDERERKHSELIEVDETTELEELLREVGRTGEKAPTPDEYVCPKCSYTSPEPFRTCPKCGTNLSWE